MLKEAVCAIKCARCGVLVNPLVGRYLFLAAGWRGARRNRHRPRETRDLVFCGPCGTEILEELVRQGTANLADVLYNGGNYAER